MNIGNRPVRKPGRPICVVGTGRCGTSATAKLLIDNGVFMGSRLLAADRNNPGGHWEDNEFRTNDNRLFMGEIDREKWRKRVEDLVRSRTRDHKLWGWKHPGSSLLIRDYHKIAAPNFIWCTRDYHDTVYSFVRAYGWTAERALGLVQARLSALSDFFETHEEYLRLDLEEHQAGHAEAKIRSWLGPPS